MVIVLSQRFVSIRPTSAHVSLEMCFLLTYQLILSRWLLQRYVSQSFETFTVKYRLYLVRVRFKHLFLEKRMLSIYCICRFHMHAKRSGFRCVRWVIFDTFLRERPRNAGTLHYADWCRPSDWFLSRTSVVLLSVNWWKIAGVISVNLIIHILRCIPCLYRLWSH